MSCGITLTRAAQAARADATLPGLSTATRRYLRARAAAWEAEADKLARLDVLPNPDVVAEARQYLGTEAPPWDH